MGKFKVGDRVVYLPCKESGEWTGLVLTGKGDEDSGWWGFAPDEGKGYFFEHQLELVGETAIDAHYTKYPIQPMEFSLANGLDAAQHTVIKYTVRYRDKGGIRDLLAAIRVLELMIEREEKAQANG